MRYHLLLDADDTLWENNIFYEQAVDAFFTFLVHPYFSREELRTMLDEIERRMGYGSVSFTRSLVELYSRVMEREPCKEDLEYIQRLGESTGNYPIQMMQGVIDTLEYLMRRHDMALVTKGDVTEQQGKIDRSGIKDCFSQTFIVQEKDAATYHRILEALRLDPKHTWMVGNSPRSDINPALAAGLNAVFIPHPQTWRLEHEQIHDPGDGRLLMLTTFADLRSYF